MGDKWIPLAYFSNAAEAGMVDQLLRNNGIDTILQGANFGALEPLPLTGGFSEIKLLVRESELEASRELYEAFFQNDGSELPND